MGMVPCTLDWMLVMALLWMPFFLHAATASRVQSLGREDPLEKGMANHSSILAWEIPWTEEPGEPQTTELLRVRQLND